MLTPTAIAATTLVPPGLICLLRPTSIAVVGATPRHFAGTIPFINCRSLRFRGRVTPISTTRSDVAGLKTVPRIADLDHVPDVAVILLDPARAAEAAADAVSLGVRALVIPGGGITDSGDAAHRLNAEIKRLATEFGVHVAGPNAMGVVDLVTGAAPYIGTVPPSVRRGSVALLSHSGAVVEAFVNSGGRVPLSTVVSMGAEIATTTGQFIDAFAQDDQTSVVLGFLEGLGDAASLLAAVRRLTDAGKVFVTVLVGRSAISREGISAHSGKLAPAHRVAAAAIRQAGGIVVSDLDELMAAGEILGTGRRVRGARVHAVTNSGGQGNLLADLAQDAGLELPPMSAAGVDRLTSRWPAFHVANPLDPWGVDDYLEVYPEALAVAAGEPGDIVLMAIDQQTTSGLYERRLGADLARILGEVSHTRDVTPIFLSPVSQDPPARLVAECRRARIPLLRGASPALRAIAALAAGPGPGKPGNGHPGRGATPAKDAPARGDGSGTPLSDQPTEQESLEALAFLGLPIPVLHRARSVSEAVSMASLIGFPVVIKAVLPGLLHKTELGLVRVGLGNATSVRDAASDLLARSRELGASPELLVMEQARGDLEVYVGMVIDRDVGPSILLGLGGIWAEVLDVVDIHVGLPSQAEAERFVSASRVGQLASQARGGPLPVEPIVAAVLAASRFSEREPRAVAIDINPMLVGRHGAVAVDCSIQLAPPITQDAPVLPTRTELS